MSVGIALIGSGIFVHEQYLPAIQGWQRLTLKAIYSRSLKSAKALAEAASDATVELYSEDAGEGKGYDDLLKRVDVRGVIIALPILAQPSYIRRALNAGKHVLSEKPIAQDLSTAQDLLTWYRTSIASDSSTQQHATWSVAENFRFQTSLLHASAQIKDLGRILNFSVKMHTFVKPGSKYFETSWRKTPEYQGGFLLDGGVHFTAGIRLLLAAANTSIAELAAYTAQLQQHLPPVDTVDATMKTNTGVTGVFSVSFGTTMPAGLVYDVACEKGSVTVTRGKVIVRREGSEEDSKEFPDEGAGVREEVDAWAKAMAEGGQTELSKRQSPEEALADLEALEAMLRSGEIGGAPMELELQEKSALLNG